MKQLLLSACLLFCCVNSVYSQGQLVFEEKNVDLSYILDQSVPLHATFKFKNVGNYPITIDRVIASSSRITVEYPHDAIKPNESGTIEAYYPIHDFQGGDMKKSLRVKCSDSEEVLRLTFQASIRPPKQRLNDLWYRTCNNSQGKLGITSIDGKVLLAEEYDDIRDGIYANNGLIARKDNNYYYYDKNAKFVFKVACDELIWSTGLKLLYARKGELSALFNEEGKCIIPFERQYCSMSQASGNLDGIRVISKKGYYALCNENGDEVFQLKEDFDAAYYLCGRFAVISHKDNHYYIYDINGNVKANFSHKELPKDLVPYLDISENGDIIFYVHNNIWMEFSPKKVVGNIKDYIAPSKNPMK